MKVNSTQVTGATFLVDSSVDRNQPTKYFVAKVGEPLADAESSAYLLVSAESATIFDPIHPPEGFHANDCAPGDLDGDGEYELLSIWSGAARDNSRGVSVPNQSFMLINSMARYCEDHSWQDIREGAQYTQFWSMTSMAMAKASSLQDSRRGLWMVWGKVIGDAKADHRIQEGLARGSCCLGLSSDVFDGRAWRQQLIRRTTFHPRGGKMERVGRSQWQSSRSFLACAAYLDAREPACYVPRLL